MTTYIELQKQIAELQAKADALKTSERNGVIERMKEAIAVYGITAADLGLQGAARGKGGRGSGSLARAISNSAKGDAAYSDGKGNVWGGRGPRPRWLKEALAGGAKLEDFAAKT